MFSSGVVIIIGIQLIWGIFCAWCSDYYWPPHLSLCPLPSCHMSSNAICHLGKMRYVMYASKLLIYNDNVPIVAPLTPNNTLKSIASSDCCAAITVIKQWLIALTWSLSNQFSYYRQQKLTIVQYIWHLYWYLSSMLTYWYYFHLFHQKGLQSDKEGILCRFFQQQPTGDICHYSLSQCFKLYRHRLQSLLFQRVYIVCFGLVRGVKNDSI